MMTRFFFFVAFFVTATAPLTSYACMMSADEKAALFKTYDTDHNSEVSVDEFLAGEKNRSSVYDEENLLELFVDTDHDGSETLSSTEFSPTNGNKRCGG